MDFHLTETSKIMHRTGGVLCVWVGINLLEAMGRTIRGQMLMVNKEAGNIKQ